MLILKNGYVMPMGDMEPFIGDVRIENGLIAELGKSIDVQEAEIIDCTNLYVLPGFIDAHCHIGMWEDGMGEEGADGNECSDPITPHMRAIDGINPHDRCFQEAYESGITTVVTGPGSANVIGGQFAALKTYGRTVDEMILKAPIAMKAALGENPKREYGDQKVSPYTRMAIASLFRKTMEDVREYAQKIKEGEEDCDKKPDKDVALDALIAVLEGDLTLKVHAHRADDIATALRLAKEFSLRITLEHCTEGHLITDVLKEAMDSLDIGIILGPLLCDRSKIELRNQTVAAPRIMHEAGIPFALMTDHPVIPIQYLPICAALAVKEGLSEDVALKAITSTAAKIVGLDSMVGSLKVGMCADIAVFDGRPLDIMTHCVQTFIDGKSIYKR